MFSVLGRKYGFYMATGRAEDSTSKQKIYNKWTRNVIEWGGYVSIPNLLLTARKELGITPSEYLLLNAIECHRWDSDTNPYPSIPRLAYISGYSERHVLKLVSSLETKGLLCHTHGRNSVNVYDIQPLIDKLDLIALSGKPRLFDHAGPDEMDTQALTNQSGKEYTLNNIKEIEVSPSISFKKNGNHSASVDPIREQQVSTIIAMFEAGTGVICDDDFNRDYANRLIEINGFKMVEFMTAYALEKQSSNESPKISKPAELAWRWSALKDFKSRDNRYRLIDYDKQQYEADILAKHRVD